MPRVVGIDPGTVSIDVCGLDDGRLTLDRAWPTVEAVADPDAFADYLISAGVPQLIAGPSGYGLPLVSAADATDADWRLAFLAPTGEEGGIGGLRRLVRTLTARGLPLMLTPGVIHLDTVPTCHKLNRVDLGTADKLCVAALAIADQAERFAVAPSNTELILLELGGAFTAAIAVRQGQVVDGVGGSSGPMGWRSSGAWDGEVAFLAGEISKEMIFRGGVESAPDRGVATRAAIEGAIKTVRALTASVATPREILLSGRHATDPAIQRELADRLADIAPVRLLTGFARVAKQGAQGAALMADGLAGGRHQELVETMRLARASGTVLDHLVVVTQAQARRRLGLH